MGVLQVMSERDALLPLDLPEESLSQNAGILPAQWIKRLAQRGHIRGQPLDETQIQPASLDLRLGKVAYKIHASFLPGTGFAFSEKIERLVNYSMDLSQPQILQRGSIYLIEIEEVLELPSTISATANPKSSTGRLDIFTRIIADKNDVFDDIPAGYAGRLWAEVSPRTFDVMVHRGSRLSQIRFRRRNPQQHRHQNLRLTDAALEELHLRSGLTDERPIIRGGLNLRVNLTKDNGSNVIAFRAKKITPFIDLDKVNHYPVDSFWDRIEPSADGSLILTPGEFYILASKEKVHIPRDYAAEMVAFDPVMGEFRVHYAGFFDPGFGSTAEEGPGSKAVLEVRTYDFPCLVEDGSTIGRLAFEKLSDPPLTQYGEEIASNYQGQRLKLSKHFKDQ